jgi:hypothetical protein
MCTGRTVNNTSSGDRIRWQVRSPTTITVTPNVESIVTSFVWVTDNPFRVPVGGPNILGLRSPGFPFVYKVFVFLGDRKTVKREVNAVKSITLRPLKHSTRGIPENSVTLVQTVTRHRFSRLRRQHRTASFSQPTTNPTPRKQRVMKTTTSPATRTPTSLDDILTAVKALCGRHDNPQHVTDDVTGKRRIVCLQADGLLASIRDAVCSGIGAHEGHTPLAEKNILNTGALELYTEIEEQISHLHHALTRKPDYLYPEQTLAAWCVAFTAQIRAARVSETTQTQVRDLLDGWVARIRAYFDPPRLLEITTSCPVCGERYAYNPDTGQQIPAVVVQFRDTLGPTMLDEATGLCRFCEAVWKGRHALRELRFDIDARCATL